MEVYKVPLVSSNLHPHEMILQMADTMDYLDAVSNEIFSKIDARMRESRQRIQNISQRVDVAQHKIGLMSGSRKATRIFSSSRFPATLQSTAPKLLSQSDLPPMVTLTSGTLGHSSEDVQVDNDAMFYPAHHTHSSSGTNPSPVPPESVSELLIFNTEDLAFREKCGSERGAKTTLRRKHDSADAAGDGAHLGDAPWSISQREPLERTNPLNYSYMPGISLFNSF